MDNIFIKRKKELGLSYSQIGDMLGVNRANAFTFISNPGRSGMETILKVAEILQIPESEAKTCWKEAKKEAFDKKIDSL